MMFRGLKTILSKAYRALPTLQAPQASSSRGIVYLSWALIIASTLISTGCNQQTEAKKPAQATVVVRLVHDPEVRALLSSAKENFYQGFSSLPDGTPIALELVPELAVPAARRLASGELKAEAWLTPLHSLAQYANSQVAPLGAKQIECQPIFRTPLVVVVPAQLSAHLNAQEGHVSWSALMDQIKTEGERTGNYPLSYSHGFPEYSASGTMALTFLTRVASGARATAEPVNREALPNSSIEPAVIQTLQAWQRLVSHYGMSESYLMERVARSNLKRLYISLAAEQQLKLFQSNQGSEGSRVVGLFPDEGTIWNNYQICISDAPWVTPAHRATIAAFIESFSSPAGRALPERFGFRPLHPSPESSEPTPADLGELSAVQLSDLLTRWPTEMMKPGALMIVLDASGSMEGDSLRAAKDSLRNLLPRLSRRDEIGLVTFASEVKDRLPVGTKLADIFNTLDTVRAIGGSSAYDAIKVGVDGLSVPNLNGHRRTLLIITDGEGANSELSLQGIQDYLSNRLTRYDMNILIIGLKRDGGGFADLQRIARTVNGFFREAAPSELVSVIQDAMRNI